MPDISMCNNKECPLSIKCYRFMTRPEHNQWYSQFEPDGDKCDFFIDINERNRSNNQSKDIFF